MGVASRAARDVWYVAVSASIRFVRVEVLRWSVCRLLSAPLSEGAERGTSLPGSIIGGAILDKSIHPNVLLSFTRYGIRPAGGVVFDLGVRRTCTLSHFYGATFFFHKNRPLPVFLPKEGHLNLDLTRPLPSLAPSLPPPRTNISHTSPCFGRRAAKFLFQKLKSPMFFSIKLLAILVSLHRTPLSFSHGWGLKYYFENKQEIYILRMV